MATKTATKPEGPSREFAGDLCVDDTLPDKKMLNKANGLVMLDEDRKQHTFESLRAGKGKVLVIFIRHFFCCNCQEYIRTLASDLPPATLASLPTPISLIVVGCGSPDLISMYKRETSSPFPVYADPTGKIYEVFGMTKTLALGNKGPEYMRQPMLRIMFQSLVQELKSGRYILSGGDYRQVGGEFLYEKDGTVSWCHRMKNTRDHTELDQLRQELQMDRKPDNTNAVPPGKTIGSRRSISGAGLVRKLSDRRKSWRNSLSRGRPGTTQPNGTVSREAMERLKEEDDAPDGDRDTALAKLTGAENGNVDEPHTNGSIVNGSTEKSVGDAVVSERLLNGTAKPDSYGKAVDGQPDHTGDKPLTQNTTSEHKDQRSTIGPKFNGSADTSHANGTLHDSTPFVRSLMNGSIDMKAGKVDSSADEEFEDAKESAVADGTANGHTVEA